ncbi:hypothetical protein AYO44_11780 [Planctomycetaceae bacterium SCGC AG-212-F19]|nr:hypothetical protein AYO44_11780 [Planctomycetaceae bacterium SCGC AG-212-F19]
MAVGLLQSSPSGVQDSQQADCGKFFAGLTGSAGTSSPPAGNSDSSAGVDGRDWVWQVAALLVAAGVTALGAVGYDPAATNRKELSAFDLATRDGLR